MDCSLPGSCVHGISQARILDWVAISFSRGSSQPNDRTQVSCIAGSLLHCRQILYLLSHQEAHSLYNSLLLLIPHSQCISSLTPPPWQPQVSSVPMWVRFIHKFTCVIFYIPYISDIVWYLSFSFWLISLSMIMLLQWHYFTSSLSVRLSMEI